MSDCEDFIKMYGKEIGLADLSLNDDGVCSLTFDKKINVDIVYRKEFDQLAFVSSVCVLPPEGKEHFYLELLKSNAFGFELAGCSLGVDAEKGNVILSYVLISSIITYDLFKAVLANFVDLSEEWINKSDKLSSDAISSVGALSQDFGTGYDFARV